MSNLLSHAETELRYAGLYDDDSDYGGMTAKAVMELMKVFSAQGHSGASAGIVIEIFSKLARYEPLSPLTGDDDEWCEVSDGVFQNKRCSHVFKQADRFDGRACDINGKIFREPNGLKYTSRDSCVVVEFPYTPKSEIVDVKE